LNLIEPLPWDTSFFGVEIARVRDGVGPEEIGAAAAEADASGIDCLYLLVAAEADELIDAAQRQRFRVRDVRVTLGRPVSGHPASLDGLRRVGVDGLAELEAVARERLQCTRFFADPNFSRDRARELYVAWLHRGLESCSEGVVLASVAPAAFVVCRLDTARRIGAIELIAVASDADGRGVGSMLVAGAGALYAEASLTTATVVTQGRNLASQRLFQRHGYRTTATQLWLHRWRVAD
jgi:ribosomal protein S18 acetylase RimI-like enzyme